MKKGIPTLSKQIFNVHETFFPSLTKSKTCFKMKNIPIFQRFELILISQNCPFTAVKYLVTKVYFDDLNDCFGLSHFAQNFNHLQNFDGLVGAIL